MENKDKYDRFTSWFLKWFVYIYMFWFMNLFAHSVEIWLYGYW